MTSSDSTFICHNCKDSLVHFHNFKRKVGRFKNFKEILRLAQVFVFLEPSLKLCFKGHKLSDLKAFGYSSNELLIAPELLHERYKIFRSSQPEVVDAAIVRHQENLPENAENELKDEGAVQTEVDTVQLAKPSNVRTKQEATRTPRWNTNSDLSEEQKVWIFEDAKSSEVNDGNKTMWKCSQCGSLLSSQWVLRKHLRDTHIIKLTREKKRGREFMDEVRASKGFTKLDDGQCEVFWKCQRCDNTLKSESGFIKHLLYSHIKSSFIDPSFIASCKILIEYEDGRPSENAWSCPECKKLYRAAIGIKNHLKLDHPEIDFGGENYQRKLKEVEERSRFLKEEEKQSEIFLQTESGERKIWQCHRCQESRFFRSESGFKAHVRHFHLKNRNIDEKKVAACKLVVTESRRNKIMWKCCLCTTVMKTKDGFISHVIEDHPFEFETSDQEKITVENQSVVNVDETVLQKLTEQVSNDRRGALKADGYKFSCDECGLYFKKHFPTHLEAHRTFSELAHCFPLPKCELCHVIFSSDESLLKHLETHIDESQNFVIYESKGLAFFGGKEFKEPTGTAVDAIDGSAWKCGHCSAMFWDELECIQHQMMLHMEKLFCPIDHLTFSGSRGLSQFCSHMKNKHPELFTNISYPCTYCQQEFSSIFNKLAHMKNCTEKKLQCDGCAKMFFSKVKLAHHLKVEKGLLSYDCHLCNRKYTNSMELKLHIFGFHTTSRLYPCTFQGCDKTFKTSAQRSSHLELHSNVTLKCQFCESFFKKRVVLARHMKLMHDETHRKKCFNELTCKLCSKSFLSRNSFKSHLKSIHNIIEEDQEM